MKAGDYRPKSRAEIARNMSAIRSCDNRADVALRRQLHGLGLRFRVNVRTLTGKPDIVFAKAKVAVFVDGDYWHARVLRERGSSALKATFTRKQQPYWVAKLTRNMVRDDFVTGDLSADGWDVVRLWESEVLADLSAATKRVAALVRKRSGSAASSVRLRPSLNA